MKTLFINKAWAILALCSLAFTSCGDKEDDEDPTAAQTSCAVNKVEFFENGVSDGSVMQIEYNAQGYVTKMTEKDGNTTISTNTFEYNSQNQQVKETFSEDGGDYTGYNTFEYNPNGTLSKQTTYIDGQIVFVETYIYDASKRLIETRETSMGDTYKTTYAYIGATQNISMKMHYTSDGEIGSMYTFEDYDDKLNPVLAVKGMVVPDESRNNPRKETYSYANFSEETTYSYKYNGSGFPTEIVSRSPGSPDTYKTVFGYAGCQ